MRRARKHVEERELIETKSSLDQELDVASEGGWAARNIDDAFGAERDDARYGFDGAASRRVEESFVVATNSGVFGGDAAVEIAMF